MSLNKSLQAMLRQRGRPAHYREDNRVTVATALITPCTGSFTEVPADLTGIPRENRFVYISVSSEHPPALGTAVTSGGREYRVEQNGKVSVDRVIDYVWALLVLVKEEM